MASTLKKVESFVVGGMCLAPGTAVLGGMADGDMRYLPEWAPLSVGWGIGAILTLAGAFLMWLAYRRK